MYNGIGLTTPRGSGTNGHVQRNWAFVRPKEKDKTYRTEEELCRLDTASNRPPNKEILDHERKRKVELKCAEFADILEDQGFSAEAVKNKVNNYRIMLSGHDGKLDRPIGHWARVSVTETHHLAEAQQEKNARLREAFGISEYFVDGSSFDPDREAKEQVARSVALQEKEQQKALEREKEKEQEKLQAARYELVHTPSPEPPLSDVKKKKKRKAKDSSSSEDQKKRKKSKKRKKQRSTKSKDKKKRKRKHSSNSSDSEDSSTDSGDSESEVDKRKLKKLKKKEKKKSIKKKRTSSESSHESSPEVQKHAAEKPNKKLKNKEKGNDIKKSRNAQARIEYDHNKNRSSSPKHTKRLQEKQDEQVRSKTPERKYSQKTWRDDRSHDFQNSNVQNDRRIRTIRSRSPNYRRSSKSPYRNKTNSKHDSYARRSRSPYADNNNHKQRRSRSNHRRCRTPSYDSDKHKQRNTKHFESKSAEQRGKSPLKRRDSIERRRSRSLRRSPELKRALDLKTEPSKKKSSTKTNESKRRESTERLGRNNLSPEMFTKTPPRIEQHIEISHNLSQSKTPPRELKKIEESKREKSPKRKTHQQKPIVRLRSASEDGNSDNDNENEDEEKEKEMRMLRLLKSGLAAKAKESLEKKVPKKQDKLKHDQLEENQSPKIFDHRYAVEPNVFDIKVLPLKIDTDKEKDAENNVLPQNYFANDKTLGNFNIKSFSSSRSRSGSPSKSVNALNVAKSKSRSYSRSPYRSSSSSSSHQTTSRSPSRAHSSPSRSRSSSRSSSSDSSRSRSPSIPRRHGSPSFLDRRRITSRKV
ncbi:hypothetical protein FQA39_LY09943 [Lamprigera yunnana]|nr:hypothetical protein FQA39_LY09943 [Lamprigera yunnana]